jgi:hypothetical protein
MKVVGNCVRTLRGRVLNGQRWEKDDGRKTSGMAWRVTQLGPKSTAQGAPSTTPIEPHSNVSDVSDVSAPPPRAKSGRGNKMPLKVDLTVYGTTGGIHTSDTSDTSSPPTPIEQPSTDDTDDNSPARAKSGQGNKKGGEENLTVSPPEGSTSSASSVSDVIPCARCGGTHRWNDNGVARCMACYPPPRTQGQA